MAVSRVNCVLPSDYAPALAAERDTHIQSILGRLADFVQAAPEERNMTSVSEAIREILVFLEFKHTLLCVEERSKLVDYIYTLTFAPGVSYVQQTRFSRVRRPLAVPPAIRPPPRCLRSPLTRRALLLTGPGAAAEFPLARVRHARRFVPALGAVVRHAGAQHLPAGVSPSARIEVAS